MKPLVSVVIPTYNRRDLVLRALESVFGQTYRPMEVIVVDDGSTDGTFEALTQATFPVKVEVLRLPTNQGPGATRNAGILHASGKYVAFLDSDDVWHTDNLERLVTQMEGSSTPEKTLAFAQVWIKREHEVFVAPARAKASDESMADYLFANGGFVSTSAVALPTAVAREVLFNPRMRIHQDWDFYMRLEERGMQFALVPIPLGITFDIELAGRQSAPKPGLSLAILEQWRPKISQRAYLGLRARIAPQLRRQAPLRALRYIIEAYLHGAISTWFFVALMGRMLHPKLRTLAYFIRARLPSRRAEYRQFTSLGAQYGFPGSMRRP